MRKRSEDDVGEVKRGGRVKVRRNEGDENGWRSRGNIIQFDFSSLLKHYVQRLVDGVVVEESPVNPSSSTF